MSSVIPGGDLSSVERNAAGTSKAGQTFPVAFGFASGAVTILLAQLFVSTDATAPSPISHLFLGKRATPNASFPGDIGSTHVHPYPPASPTNAIPSLFPTDVGFAGNTAPGGEPFVVATAAAYPTEGGVDGLIVDAIGEAGNGTTPSWIEGEWTGEFELAQSWGGYSPFYSVPRGSFGVDSTPEVPSGCQLKGVHILHRHGARYPTSSTGFGAAGGLAARLHNVSAVLEATGPLSFLKTYTYKLGEAALTHFGRQQMMDLGVSMRMKYGVLLEDFTDSLPVIRTTSEDRVRSSSANFAFGFFGWPTDGKFETSIVLEGEGFNNTLSPDDTCPNDEVKGRGDRGSAFLKEWTKIYLVDARDRLQRNLKGYNLTTEDVYAMQQTCAFETVSLGYSAFCSLFTQAEWEGYEYSHDLKFYYDSAFGSPVARAQGTGYLLELLSRLTHTQMDPASPIVSSSVNNTSQFFAINMTLATNPIIFPVNNSIYVDGSHDNSMLMMWTALNLTSLAGLDKEGPPDPKKMKRGRTWVSSRVVPFGANMQIQLLTCDTNLTATTTDTSSSNAAVSTSTQLRVIINDAPVSLAGISGCPDEKDGMCPLDTFVDSMKTFAGTADYDWTCFGNWTITTGTTFSGDPPPKP